MKQELINEAEANFADLSAASLNFKAALLRLDNLEEKALEAGADVDKIARLRDAWEHMKLRYRKLNEAKNAFHAVLHAEFLDDGGITVFTGT
mgnify:CR=1 FL=1